MQLTSISIHFGKGENFIDKYRVKVSSTGELAITVYSLAVLGKIFREKEHFFSNVGHKCPSFQIKKIKISGNPDSFSTEIYLPCFIMHYLFKKDMNPKIVLSDCRLNEMEKRKLHKFAETNNLKIETETKSEFSVKISSKMDSA